MSDTIQKLYIDLKNKDENERRQAVQELGKLQDWKGVEQGLRDTKPVVRKEAVSALVKLGEMGDRETALGDAHLALHDPNSEAREEA